MDQETVREITGTANTDSVSPVRKARGLTLELQAALDTLQSHERSTAERVIAACDTWDSAAVDAACLGVDAQLLARIGIAVIRHRFDGAIGARVCRLAAERGARGGVDMGSREADHCLTTNKYVSAGILYAWLGMREAVNAVITLCKEEQIANDRYRFYAQLIEESAAYRSL